MNYEFKSRPELIKYLKDNQIWLKKSYGQHFLIDPQYLDSIVQAAEIKKDATVIEVGPGLGVLTQYLSDSVPDGQVLSIEADFKLVEHLRDSIGKKKNVKIIHTNALLFNWDTIAKPYKVVANLPYNIASPLLYNWLITTKNSPQSITVMLQKEVAYRLLAKPGTKQRGLPTIMVELSGQAKLVTDVSKEAFFPIPKVESAIIHIADIKQSVDRQLILKVAKAGFSNKRRTIENSLSGSFRLPKNQITDYLKRADINPGRRAETLSVDEWQKLTSTLKLLMNND